MISSVLDIAIFIIILIINLVVGLYSSRSISNIREYAVGRRDFTTVALVCTLVATWLSGADFIVFISETYLNGLYFVFAFVFGCFALCLLIGLVFIPRMSEFLGALSIAEAMGGMYGNRVRAITAISGSIATAGVIAAELKVSGLIFNYCLGLPSYYGILVSGLLVTVYASFGGIKAVTFTDMVQLFTFATIVPSLAFFIFNTLDGIEILFDTIRHNPIFNIKEVFDLTNPKFLQYLLLFFYVIIPGFGAPIFQRVIMARNVHQARKVFVISAFVFLIINLIMCWMGVVTLAAHPSMSYNDIVKQIILDYSYTGFRGLILAGVMTMVMSTVDSSINSTSILFVHDFCSSIGLKIKRELLVTRIVAFTLGIFAICIALYSENILQLIIKTRSFYMPIVTVPFLFAVFGFRTSTRSVLIGMISGFLVVIFWELFLENWFIDSLIPAMASNALFLLGSHYLMDYSKEGIGWVGIKDNSLIETLKKDKRRQRKKIIRFLLNFNLKELLSKNAPLRDEVYVYVGFYAIFSMYFSFYNIPNNSQLLYSQLITFMYVSVHFLSGTFISYPLWKNLIPQRSIQGAFWCLSIFYMFVVVSITQSLISNFNHFQMVTLLLDLVVLAILTRWQMALSMIILGLIVSSQIYSLLPVSTQESYMAINWSFLIIYSLLCMSSILIAFFKPQQEYLAATEEKAEILGKKSNHLSARVEHQEQEIKRLSRVSDVILNNVNHELRLPITGVINFSEMIDEQAQKLGDEYIQMLSRDLNKSSLRLSTMMLSMLDLATFNARKIKLKKEKFDISQMVRERIELCKKIYLEDKPIDFKLHLQSYLPIVGDKNYLMQVIDNLITNSINYSDGGVIDIRLYFRVDDMIEFAVIDEGKGISDDELESVFRPFKVGSRTSSPAGGRGLGLSLCKAVIESHGGSIRAFSRNKGAHISFLLPS